LRRGNEAGQKPYFTYDGHWSRAGHRLAAEEVQRFIASHGWLEGCGGLDAGR